MIIICSFINPCMHLPYLYGCVYNTPTIMHFMFADKLWIGIHNTTLYKAEQSILNYALKNLGVRWRKTTSVDDICRVQSGWWSYGPLNCMVFPQKDVCRRCCRSALTHNYYVLHPISKKLAEKKPGRLKSMQGWFLSNRWKHLSTSVGATWLRNIYSHS